MCVVLAAYTPSHTVEPPAKTKYIDIIHNTTELVNYHIYKFIEKTKIFLWHFDSTLVFVCREKEIRTNRTYIRRNGNISSGWTGVPDCPLTNVLRIMFVNIFLH